MKTVYRCVCGAMFAAALFLPLAGTGCSAHVGYRVYDPYHTDYHTFGPDEDVYYRRWLGERHLEYRDFRRLKNDERKEYFTWRHAQEHK